MVYNKYTIFHSFNNLKKFGTSNKDAIVSTISQADTEVLSKDQMKDGFKFVMDSLVSIYLIVLKYLTLLGKNPRKQ